MNPIFSPISTHPTNELNRIVQNFFKRESGSLRKPWHNSQGHQQNYSCKMLFLMPERKLFQLIYTTVNNFVMLSRLLGNKTPNDEISTCNTKVFVYLQYLCLYNSWECRQYCEWNDFHFSCSSSSLRLFGDSHWQPQFRCKYFRLREANNKEQIAIQCTSHAKRTGMRKKLNGIVWICVSI